MTRPSPISVLALPLVLLLTVPPAAGQQTVRVDVEEENFRQTPGGKRLATVNRGTALHVTGRRGQWREVVLEGWIWTPSVSPTDRGGFDLVVSADGGENLRDGPDPGARVAARLLEGFLLREVERSGDWTRVRRVGWMWAPSLTGAAPPSTPAEEGGEGEGTEGFRERVVVGEQPAPLLLSPDGDTVAAVRPGSDLVVLARRGDWARVRMEGWVRTLRLRASDTTVARTDLSPSDLRANPEQYEGRRVVWEVQFISLERAEAARTDFYEGEPFILARMPESGSGFVYLAVPPEFVSRVESLTPLQRLRVLARVRTGRSALMGAPVLDLLEFEPLPRD